MPILGGSGTVRNFDYWLGKDPNLIYNLFKYEDKYNFRWTDQIRLMMQKCHQPYSEIMLIPTDIRLRIIKDLNDEAIEEDIH